MARHKLENELIAIEVEEHGAELKSLRSVKIPEKNICGKLIQNSGDAPHRYCFRLLER